MTDARIAAIMSRAHDMSDSDSDATVEPPDYSGSWNGSQDLFDTAGSPSFSSKSSSSSFDRSRKSEVLSSPKTSSIPKVNVSLSKKISKTHEISDSESDSADDNRSSKQALGLGLKGGNSNIKSSLESRKGSSLEASPKLKANSLSKRLSQTYELSDSEDDYAHTSKASTSSGSKSVCALKHESKSNPTFICSTSSQSQNSLLRLSHKISKVSSSGNEDITKRGGSASDLKLHCSAHNSDMSKVTQDGASHKSGGRPSCKYGDRCYRINANHFQEFDHRGYEKGKRKTTQTMDKDVDIAKKKPRSDERPGVSWSQGPGDVEKVTGNFMKTVADVVSEFQPMSLFLTKVSGIDDKFNSIGAVSMKDILSPLMGNLQASCQFNFMIDIPWLVKQYPKQFRDKPLLLVHGEQGRSETELNVDGASFRHISFCRAKLEMMYGTHHTKMMLLLYDSGMRVVIHTANLIDGDWCQKTQGVWISPLFPKLPVDDAASVGKGMKGDSPTRFKADLLAYLSAYHAVPLTPWEKHIQQHDMSSASVHIIASVPGRHTGGQKSAWGHLKLRKVLQTSGLEKKDIGSWPVFGQFSSIGSLGASPHQWLCDEWLASLSQCQGTMSTPLHDSKLHLVYPSKENVRLCLEGYAGGGCLPYSIKTAQKQIYLNNYVRKWGSEGRGRTEAIPHIKTYTRVSPDFSQAAWFLVTSANLSKAAWGALEKQKTQLMIRSYEIGVLFLPKYFGVNGSFPVAKTTAEVIKSKEIMLPFPYDLPPPTYQKGDRIWMWDVPCVDLPDTHGKKYCPRL
ncbi:tyrosyl-DNA phosphodiesterase 1-like isoform X2 [Babylonia areolata]